jgi:3-oxoacyl-[acyl-carrier protein] reductase
MDLGIAKKRALVCAASKGLGKAIAFDLAREGVELYLCARGEEDLKVTAQAIEAETGQKVHYQTCDLSNNNARQQLINNVLKVFPTIDILIHNVGGPKASTVEETSLDTWESGFHQLFQSVAHLNQGFLPAMKDQHWGRIIIITSGSVLEPVPNLAVSNAMRSAVTSMAKTLSDEIALYNITINCVAPGVIHTDRTEERIQAAIAKSGGSHEQYMTEYVKSIPMGRLGRPDEFAHAVCFLCSEQASYITGVTLSVDGGKRRSTI